MQTRARSQRTRRSRPQTDWMRNTLPGWRAHTCRARRRQGAAEHRQRARLRRRLHRDQAPVGPTVGCTAWHRQGGSYQVPGPRGRDGYRRAQMSQGAVGWRAAWDCGCRRRRPCWLRIRRVGRVVGHSWTRGIGRYCDGMRSSAAAESRSNGQSVRECEVRLRSLLPAGGRRQLVSASRWLWPSGLS
ncbi:hypothetical protein BCR44DRAFT_1153554 [Catenaria anguillulae PL171]|uniref:Uncharacterized protein n=1 Tax=Catenaria anguillulae PL171 TaxID=765915 RepID=A0A1Y2HIL1_9FUNG|nr:hypothetical protein BCR44DRAFT_1153554 [Catenaria anguillulae PL171]